MQREIDQPVGDEVVVNYLDHKHFPGHFDIVARFRVCMDNERKRIPQGKADGYFGIWKDEAMIGVWYFTIVDGLMGPARSYLLDWPEAFKELMGWLKEYVPDGYRLDGCRVKFSCAPHIKTFQEGSHTTVILF